MTPRDRYEIVSTVRASNARWLEWQPDKGTFHWSLEYWAAVQPRRTWCQWIATDPCFRTGDWT